MCSMQIRIRSVLFFPSYYFLTPKRTAERFYCLQCMRVCVRVCAFACVCKVSAVIFRTQFPFILFHAFLPPLLFLGGLLISPDFVLMRALCRRVDIISLQTLRAAAATYGYKHIRAHLWCRKLFAGLSTAF